MTDKEKEDILKELRKELSDDLAIYVGNKVIKGAAKLIGGGVIAMAYYLVSNGYIDIK